MLNSRSRSKSKAARTRGSGRALRPQPRKARRSRFDTTVQAVRVRRVGGTRGWDLDQGRYAAGPAGRARTQNKGWPMEKAQARGAARGDPRVPRFQREREQRGGRPSSHARPIAAGFPWAGLIPLNGKTALNVAVLALVGWALVWLFTSDRFYLRQVEAVGNGQVSDLVLSQVSGLEGYSVFWVNPKQVSARIMDALPPVQSVQVRYGMFDQDGLSSWVKLVVQERGQEIVWQVAGQRYWVGEGGELHEVRSPTPAERAPSALGSEPGADQPSEAPRLTILDVRPSRPAQVEQAALAGARQLIHLLPEVRVIEYAPGTGLRFRHPRGWMVYLGTGEDMAKKVGVLRAMEVEFAGEDVVQPTLVDLRFPDSPYYRLPEAESPAGAD